jgi:hypothetical protein
MFVQHDGQLAVAFPIRFIGAKEEGVRLPASMEMMKMNWDKTGFEGWFCLGKCWEMMVDVYPSSKGIH